MSVADCEAAAGIDITRGFDAHLAQNVAGGLARYWPCVASIQAPTQITFERDELATSTRYAYRMKDNISASERLILERCAHASIQEEVEAFKQTISALMQRRAVQVGKRFAPTGRASCHRAYPRQTFRLAQSSHGRIRVLMTKIKGRCTQLDILGCMLP